MRRGLLRWRNWLPAALKRPRRAELAEARALQRAAMGMETPQVPGMEIACGWEASPEVGGDYVDVFPVRDGRVALCVGDVAGKGLTAARMMMEVRGAVRAFAAESQSPAELCTRVNQALCGRIAAGKYATLFYGEIDGRTLRYEIAGHCLPLLMRGDGRLEYLASFSGVLGLFSHWLYQSQEVELCEGDCLVVLTDGIVAAESRQREEFGYQRLVSLLEARRGASAAELSREILAAVAQFCHGRLRDDASLIIVRA